MLRVRREVRSDFQEFAEILEDSVGVRRWLVYCAMVCTFTEAVSSPVSSALQGCPRGPVGPTRRGPDGLGPCFCSEILCKPIRDSLPHRNCATCLTSHRLFRHLECLIVFLKVAMIVNSTFDYSALPAVCGTLLASWICCVGGGLCLNTLMAQDGACTCGNGHSAGAHCLVPGISSLPNGVGVSVTIASGGSVVPLLPLHLLLHL